MIDQGIEINKRIEEFTECLKDRNNSIERVINKYLLFGTPYIYTEDEDLYYDLKEDIAERFHIQQTQIYIVGSSKLGFSIAPKKIFNHFNNDSDIDIAIIDNDLFNYYWANLFDFNIKLQSRTVEEEARYFEFLQYFFRGWLRPDKFPFAFKERSEWFEFFKKLYGKYQRKVAVGIYRHDYYFIEYNRQNLNKLREVL